MKLPPYFLTLLILFHLPSADFAQAPAAASSPIESVPDLEAQLTPEQKQRFDEAMKAFNSRRFADSLTIFKQLLVSRLGDAVLSKLASEAALNTGDTGFALNALKPLAAANPNDWQAAALLTRACAESGDKICRDSGMAHMLDLHRQGITPSGMQQYILEQIKTGENTLLIRTSLEPWGRYNVYDLGQVFDKGGKIFLRITLESVDADQALFATQHPKEAAAGMRSFSFDAYLETGLNSNGQRTQTHSTYELVVGQPTYDAVREEFMNIADGKAHAMSSTTNLIVP